MFGTSSNNKSCFNCVEWMGNRVIMELGGHPVAKCQKMWFKVFSPHTFMQFNHFAQRAHRNIQTKFAKFLLRLLNWPSNLAGIFRPK